MLRLWLESEGKKKYEKLLFSDPGYRKAEDSRMAVWMESDVFFRKENHIISLRGYIFLHTPRGSAFLRDGFLIDRPSWINSKKGDDGVQSAQIRMSCFYQDHIDFIILTKRK